MVGWVFAAYYGLNLSAGQKQEENVITANGYSFYVLPDNTFGTYLTIGDKKFPIAFRLDPRQAGNIELNPSVIQQILNSKKIYITFDPLAGKEAVPKFGITSAEISRVTGLYNLETIGAFTRDSNPISPNTPIKTCDDAMPGVTVIELLIADTNKIVSDKNCVKIYGKSADDLILAADKLGMNLIGIKL